MALLVAEPCRRTSIATAAQVCHSGRRFLSSKILRNTESQNWFLVIGIGDGREFSP